MDELDINSVEHGQKAVVTFDAIEDQEFEGEVTKIGNTASVSGGVAKYTITITIPKDDKETGHERFRDDHDRRP